VAIAQMSPVFTNIPATPLFARLMKEYEAYTEKTQKNRTLLASIDCWIGNVPGWHISNQTFITVPRIGPLKKTKFLQMFLLWIEIIERADVIKFPFSRTREELDEWSKKINTYSQLGIQAIELQRRDSN
jgi:hypothetical protein